MQKPLQALLAVAVLMVAIALTGLFVHPALSQAPAAPASSQVGRYQLHKETDSNEQFIIDTQTGRLWYRYGTGVKAVWEEQSPDYTKAPIVTKP